MEPDSFTSEELAILYWLSENGVILTRKVTREEMFKLYPDEQPDSASDEAS